MSLFSFANDFEVDHPIMLLAMSGWVDAASVGTSAAERIAEDGDVIARFDPDALFDYRSSRPTLHFTSGELNKVVWPRLEIVHRTIAGVDLLVVVGNEPDFRWIELTRDLVDIVGRYGVTKLVTLGAVPAPVPHTRPVRVICTTSDRSLLLEGDAVMPGDLVVPGAAVSVLRQGVADAGTPAIGYWVQVPHYLQSPFHRGVLSLLERAGAQIGVSLPIGDLATEASAQIAEISRDLAERDDAREYVERLERIHDEGGGEGPMPIISFEDLPSPDEIGAEVEKFLRSASDED